MSAWYVILAHVTWALFIRAAKTVTWALTGEWALARDTTVVANRPVKTNGLCCKQLCNQWYIIVYNETKEYYHDSILHSWKNLAGIKIY